MRAGDGQGALENQRALLPEDGENVSACAERRRLSMWEQLTTVPDSKLGDLIRRITIIQQCAVIAVLAIIVLVLGIVFALTKVQQLSDQRVQTIYVHSSVDQGKEPETPRRRPCNQGWIWYRNKCCYFSEAEGNWTEANDSCSSFDSSLALIDNQLELDFMMSQKGIHDRWIGLKKDSSGIWKWCNGTNFNNWFKIKDYSDCAFLNHHPIRSGECSNVRKWICTKV